MTIGQKLQFLRKKEGISQEQLAQKLEISRQAISKWELDQSAPEIENIVKLSELFQVTTDYLLKEQSETGNGGVSQKPNQKNRAVFVVCMGIMIIGLLLSFCGWSTYQTNLAVGIGIIFQILALIGFEVTNRSDGVRKTFYIVATWIFLPFPSMFLAQFLWMFCPFSYSGFIKDVSIVMLYLLLCGTVTTVIKRKI
ncbi:MAG: helix-turn-helix transcriptional regulator [Clostridiales bacterium]|nr:helix-turn-helix transcriptional regulator [Clostridiales bacterium]